MEAGWKDGKNTIHKTEGEGITCMKDWIKNHYGLITAQRTMKLVFDSIPHLRMNLLENSALLPE